MKKNKKYELIKKMTFDILSSYMDLYVEVEKHYNIKLSVVYEDFDNITDFIDYLNKLHFDIERAV